MLIPMETEQRWDFYRAQMPRLKKYTAVFAVSDYYALDFISFWISQGGRVPEDMSVIGFDDSPLGRMSQPPLTTIRQDYELRARTALAMLRELRESGGDGREVRLPVELVVRGTAGECTPDVR